MNGQTKLLRRS